MEYTGTQALVGREHKEDNGAEHNQSIALVTSFNPSLPTVCVCALASHDKFQLMGTLLRAIIHGILL